MAVILNRTRSSAIPEPNPAVRTSLHHQRVLGWTQEAIKEAQDKLRVQPGFHKIDQTIRFVDGDYSQEGTLSPNLSNTVANYFSKIFFVLSAALTDIRPFWEFKTNNELFEKQAIDLGRLSEHWWLSRFIDMRFVDIVKYSLVAGSGWANIFWNSEIQDIDMSPEDPRDLMPIRPADNISVQNAFGTVLRREYPINHIKALYPESAHLIKTDRSGDVSRLTSNTRAGRVFRAINDSLSPFHASLSGSDRPSKRLDLPVTDLYTVYVKDPSINETKIDVRMGEEGTKWSYIVSPGHLLYPRKRCIEFTRSAVLYDGPSIYWHGKFPYSKLTLDPTPWSWLGKGAMWDLLPLQKSLNRLLRVVDDHSDRVAQPGLIGDKNAMSRAAWAKLNTRMAGLKALHNPIAGQGMQVVHEPQLSPTILQQIQWDIDTMHDVSGTRDLTQLSNLGQIPSAETVEKIQESMSPMNRVRSRTIEAFMRELAQMTASNFLQFYSEPMRLAVLGPDGLEKYYDWDPKSMIPEDGSLGVDFYPDVPRVDRAAALMRGLTYRVTPGTLLNAASLPRKLLILQLRRGGDVDRWTMGEILEIPNMGEPPDPNARTITERLILEAQMGMGMEINPAGRKATAQTTPRITVKES